MHHWCSGNFKNTIYVFIAHTQRNCQLFGYSLIDKAARCREYGSCCNLYLLRDVQGISVKLCNKIRRRWNANAAGIYNELLAVLWLCGTSATRSNVTLRLQTFRLYETGIQANPQRLRTLKSLQSLDCR